MIALSMLQIVSKSDEAGNDQQDGEKVHSVLTESPRAAH